MTRPAAGDHLTARWRDLGLRSLTAAVLLPVALLMIWLGGVSFTIAVALLGLLIALEWSRMVFPGDRAQLVFHAASAVFFAPLVLMFGWLAGAAILGMCWSASLLCAAARNPFRFWNVVGVPYVSLPPLALVILRADELYGMVAIIILSAIVWAADTCAYFAGRAIGGPRLCPSISPSKTWVGLGGALAGGSVAGLVGSLLAGLPSAAALAMLGGFLAMVEQAGDLFESAAKRAFGIKDSGRLIPGHGGVLDRVDGLLAAVCVAALIGFWRGGADHTAAGLILW